MASDAAGGVGRIAGGAVRLNAWFVVFIEVVMGIAVAVQLIRVILAVRDGGRVWYQFAVLSLLAVAEALAALALRRL